MKTPTTPKDFFSIQNISDPQPSPDGTRIAFVVSQTDLEANRNNTAIYLLSIEGGKPRRITHGDKNDSVPRWSPDGTKIAFRSNRTGNSQIWLLDLSRGGEARQLTSFKAGLGGALWADNNHTWSPCGKWIACISRGNVEDEELKPATDMRIVERTFFKWSGGFNPNRPTHIWLVPVSGGDPVQLTNGNQDDHSLSWSPDSAEIAFVSNRTGDWDNNANNDLFAVSIQSQEIRRITDTPGPEFTPAWSPCGKWIACAASDRGNTSKDSPAGNTEIYIVPAAGGEPHNLSRTLDRRAGSPTWSPDSKWIYFTAANQGTRHVYRVPPEGGTVEPVTHGPHQIPSFSLAKNTLIGIRHNEHQPAELYRFTEGAEETALTSLNKPWCAQFETGSAEPFTFSTFDNLTVHGWVLRPIGFDPTHRYPAILSIHGGPHGTYGYSFRATHQALASAGYGVIYIDPRGSAGYGQAFADGCVNDWGGGDYKDLMLGLDAALKIHPWIDPNRLGVTGGSYGGFMTNWVITQTHRFKAGISHAGLSNHVSFYGTSMFQLLMEYEFGGKPWEAHDAYWSRSPLAHVANVQTPLLLTHGEVDHDVPIGQAEEFYIALKKCGIPATFIRYPREGHGISEPVHLKDFIQRHIDWFNKYLKPST